MPRGQPDYGMYAVTETIASLSDVGELAARLGSIVTYDRRGNVVDFDNFEEPVLRWGTTLVGTGSYARLNSDYPKSGSQCLILHTPDEASGEAAIYKALAIQGSKKLGMQISFCDLDEDCDLILEILFNQDNTRHYCRIKIDTTALKIYLWDSSGGYVEVGDFPELYKLAGAYHTLKIVAGFNTDYYMRFLLDQEQYDISSYAMATGHSVISDCISLAVRNMNRAALGGGVYIDDYVFTQAEP